MDNDLLMRAMAAFFRSCGEDGAPQQPSASASHVRSFEGKTYVMLNNANGVLAVYRVKPDGILKRLRRWPKALEA